MFGLVVGKRKVNSDTYLFRHDLTKISSEFHFLNEHYASDYPEIGQMLGISQKLVQLNDLCAIKKACSILYSKIALIQRYDVEFKVASLDLLVSLDNVSYCDNIEQ